ncbi:MAG TPA: hypothetical protein VE338_12690 [Ktedonobacterales bacterium]|jgi:hypothetical protein|nr:hypothetical protein [Ktedonobacterales bacterium]
MLVTPPSDTLGAANLASVLNAILALLMASACVLAFWALIELYGWLTPTIQRLSQRLSARRGRYLLRRWSLRDTLMTPLEVGDVDLASVRTFPSVQQVTPLTMPLAGSSVEPQIVEVPDVLPPTLPAIRTLPPTPTFFGASSVALLEDDNDNDGDNNWPPFRPGAKRYRFVLASGQLVRLANLQPFTVGLPRWFELN